MNEPLMYVVLVGLFLLIFPSLLPKSQRSAKDGLSPQVLKDMEETMDGFLAELEEDNKKLIDTMASMKQEHESAVRKLAERLETVERQLQEQRQEWHRLTLVRMERQEEELRERNRPAEPSLAPDEGQGGEQIFSQESTPVFVLPSIRSRYADLFRMYEEGKSVEYIAKKTGMNKGEVSLVIQLAAQEELKSAEK